MKFFTMIAAAILFVSATALADSNFRTYLRAVSANDTSFVWVDLPSGKSTIVVNGNNNEKISCVFQDVATGSVVYEAKDVNVCVGHSDLALPWTILARITNNEHSVANIEIKVNKN